jgi:hypothetical protein
VATVNFVILFTLAVLLQRPTTRARWMHAITRGRTKLPTADDF